MVVVVVAEVSSLLTKHQHHDLPQHKQSVGLQTQKLIIITITTTVKIEITAIIVTITAAITTTIIIDK